MTYLKMIPYLHEIFSQVFTPKCADEFSELKISELCLKIFLSKVLGYAIIAASALVKLPQIIKIINGKSAVGISIFSQFLELLAVSATVAYSLSNNFPFSSYGEGIFLSIQTCIVFMLIIYYQFSESLSYLFIATYAVIMGYLCSQYAPILLLKTFMQINIGVVIIGKFSQIVTNYKNGTTGQLSAITVTLICLGSIVRIFTTLHETGDFTMALSFIVAAGFNVLLVLQLVYYWNNHGTKKTGSSRQHRKDQQKKKQ